MLGPNWIQFFESVPVGGSFLHFVLFLSFLVVSCGFEVSCKRSSFSTLAQCNFVAFS